MMLDRNIAAEVLARAVKTGGDFAEIFLEDNTKSNIALKSGRIEPWGRPGNTEPVSGCLKAPKLSMFLPTIRAGRA